MRLRALLVVSLFLTVLASASADVVSCPAPTVPATAVGTGAATVYLDGTEVWREANAVAGLQKTPCTDDAGRDVASDARVL